MKKLIAFAFLAGAVGVVNADYLLWTVQDAEIDAFEAEQSVTVAKVRVGRAPAGTTWLYTASDPVASYATDGVNLGTEGIAYGGESGFDQTDSFKIDIDSIGGDSYSYYIELLSSSGEVLGRSTTNGGTAYETYANLQKLAVTGSIGDVPPATAAVWHGGGFEAVPEPSSMALLALGAGLVGLRRKLRKNKKGKRV